MKNLILILSILISSYTFSNSNEQSLGNIMLELLNKVNIKDSIGFKEAFLTVEEFHKLGNSALLNEKISTKLLKYNNQIRNKELSSLFLKLRKKMNDLGLIGKTFKYVSEKSEHNYHKGIPVLNNIFVFTDGTYEYEILSHHDYLLDLEKLLWIDTYLFNNISIVSISSYDVNDNFIEKYTLTRNLNETRALFQTRVLQNYFSNLINETTFQMGPGTIQFNDLNEIVHFTGASFFVSFPKLIIEGGNISSPILTYEKVDSVKFEFEIYNKNNILIYQEFYSNTLSNSGIGTNPNLKNFSLGNQNIYDYITVKIKFNDKLVFIGTDSWANFALSTMSLQKIGNKYYMNRDSSPETERRMKESFYKLSF